MQTKEISVIDIIQNKKVNRISIFIGAIMTMASIWFSIQNLSNDILRNRMCLCFILGLSLVLIGVANLFTARYYKINPKKLNQEKIECLDERNTFIRYKAKSKAGDITSWLIVALLI